MKDVQVIDGRVTVPASVSKGLDVRLRWTVEGTVEHWGHIHTRVNQYEADFSVRAVGDAWKIVAMNMLNQRRVKYQIGVRGL